MNPKKFLIELKRRNVYKVAVGYAIVGWLLIQVATQVFPFFEIPNWGIRFVALISAIAFSTALIIAWDFELTPERIEANGRGRSGDQTVAVNLSEFFAELR